LNFHILYFRKNCASAEGAMGGLYVLMLYRYRKNLVVV